MIALCRFCGSTAGRRPCAPGLDRCAECAKRLPAIAARQLGRLLEALGLARPTDAALARLTVGVGHSKSRSIGAASVGCGSPPVETISLVPPSEVKRR